jgi:hypothetical protein
MTANEFAAQVRSDAGLNILANVIGVPRSGASRAQQAVMAGLMKAAGVARPVVPTRRGQPQPAAVPLPVSAAAQRFAALAPTARHTWLVRHLAALRAGRITLAQLP